jgi:hypothetical protein
MTFEEGQLEALELQVDIVYLPPDLKYRFL